MKGFEHSSILPGTYLTLKTMQSHINYTTEPCLQQLACFHRSHISIILVYTVLIVNLVGNGAGGSEL